MVDDNLINGVPVHSTSIFNPHHQGAKEEAEGGRVQHTPDGSQSEHDEPQNFTYVA